MVVRCAAGVAPAASVALTSTAPSITVALFGRCQASVVPQNRVCTSGTSAAVGTRVTGCMTKAPTVSAPSRVSTVAPWKIRRTFTQSSGERIRSRPIVSSCRPTRNAVGRPNTVPDTSAKAFPQSRSSRSIARLPPGRSRFCTYAWRPSTNSRRCVPTRRSAWRWSRTRPKLSVRVPAPPPRKFSSCSARARRWPPSESHTDPLSASAMCLSGSKASPCGARDQSSRNLRLSKAGRDTAGAGCCAITMTGQPAAKAMTALRASRATQEKVAPRAPLVRQTSRCSVRGMSQLSECPRPASCRECGRPR